MPRYRVAFAPYDTLTYVYEVEVDDPNNARAVARDDFRYDIGHDMAKDFDTVSVDEIKEYEDD